MSDRDVEAHKRLGTIVKRERLRRRMTQRTFGELAGVSNQTLIAVEKGEPPVKPRSLWLVESALGWPAGTVDQILEGGEPPTVEHVSIPDALEEEQDSDSVEAQLARMNTLLSTLNDKIDRLLRGDRR